MPRPFPPLVAALLNTQNDLRIAGTPWFLDARTPRSHAIISHAHADHFAAHGLCVATPETCSILKHRMAAVALPWRKRGSRNNTVARGPAMRHIDLGGQIQSRAVEFGVPHALDGLTITFLPAGHVLGSAMVHVTSALGTLLYTGDFRPKRDALTVPAAQPVGADVLLMECTYGLPKYRFPPRRQIQQQLCDAVGKSLSLGRQPVCLCYSLGKAQEIARLLNNYGFKISMHGAPHAICEIYKQHGMDVGTIHRYSRDALAGAVLIAPPHVRQSRMITSLRDADIFAITGWAINSAARYRFRAQQAFAISDHADFDELNELVDFVRPSHVVLTHGFTEEFAAHLSSRGISVCIAGCDRPLTQLPLFD